MTLDIEVRSSGAGPIEPWHISTRKWHFGCVWAASCVIAHESAQGPHKHGMKQCSKVDGVAITIRVVD